MITHSMFESDSHISADGWVFLLVVMLIIRANISYIIFYLTYAWQYSDIKVVLEILAFVEYHLGTSGLWEIALKLYLVLCEQFLTYLFLICDTILMEFTFYTFVYCYMLKLRWILFSYPLIILTLPFRSKLNKVVEFMVDVRLLPT